MTPDSPTKVEVPCEKPCNSGDQGDEKPTPSPRKREIRRSECLKGKTKCNYINFIKQAILIGLTTTLTLPTTILAEPAVDLVELGPKFIEQHKIDAIPFTADDHHEKLQAYHARIDLLNSIFNPEQHDLDWQIAKIDRHLTKHIPNQNQSRIYYKVTWFGGKSQ